MNRNQKIYLDRRATTNGKPSHLHWDNSVRLGLLPPGGLAGQVLTKLTDEDYDVYWEDVTNLINVTINPIIVQGARFVMTNGDNSTAQPEMLHMPWADPFAAANALGGLSSAETVIVYPGFYNVTVNSGDRLVSSNGTIHLMEGARLVVNIDGRNADLLSSSGRIEGQGELVIQSSQAFPHSTIVPSRADIILERLTLTNTILEPYASSRLEIGILSNYSSSIRFNWNHSASLNSTGNTNSAIYTFGEIIAGNSGTPGVNMRPSNIFEFNPLQGFNADPAIDLQVPQYLTLDIGSIQYTKGDGLNGLFLFRQYIHTGANHDYIKIKVLSVRNNNVNNTFNNSSLSDSLITLDNYDGNIDIEIKHAVTDHVWLTRQGTGITGAKGTISITGKLMERHDGNYPMFHGLIDMRALNDRLVYKVDLVNYNKKWPTLFNISGCEKSVLTGRILDKANADGMGPYAEPVIGFGVTTSFPGLNNFGVLFPVLMSDLAIVTNVGQFCFSILSPLANGADIHCYNVRSNAIADPDVNRAPNYVIQPILIHPRIIS